MCKIALSGQVAFWETVQPVQARKNGRQSGDDDDDDDDDMIDRNAIQNAGATFSKVADTMQHRPTSTTNDIYVKFNMAAPQPEAAITLVAL